MRARIGIALRARRSLGGGCGATDELDAVACLEGDRRLPEGARRAPGAVTLARRDPISDCLAENQNAG